MSRTTVPHSFVWLLSLSFALVLASPLTAQRRANDPHLAYAYPAGCQQGQSCEIVLGGQHIKDVDEAYLTGEGVELEIVKWYRPLTQGEYNSLRDRLDEARTNLKEKGKRNPSETEVALAAGISEDDLREMEIYRQRDRDPKRQPNDQLEEELTVKVTVAEDAPPGKRELRLLSDAAMSNPLWIQVGKWHEVRETEPNDDTPDTVIDKLPIIVNGQVMPGDRDRFSFEAKKDQQIVIAAGARDVIPFLADAVPGWFQAVMRLTDSSGREVAYSDSFHFSQDPVMYFEVPRDDRYTVEIRDTLYRGREDFVYRITMGELPFVTSIFPLGAKLNSNAKIELRGWNLTQTEVDVKTTSGRQYRPVRWYSSDQGNGIAVRFPLQIDRLQEVEDKEPNDNVQTAQTVTTRMIVNGRIDTPGDEDVFHIQGGGGRIVAEVHARRLGSPLDSMLSLTDARGNELAFNDDHEDKSQGLLTHHADSHLVVTIPASGGYLRLSDAQGNGGEDFVYRLYLRAPEPDYELRVTPATIIARAGAVTPITVHALRKDNFNQDIELALFNPPPGFQLSGAVIPGNADRVQMTLTVPPTPPLGPVVLEMAGRAPRGRGKYVTREAVPAENMMQAFIWYHLVPVEDWTVIVSGRPGPKPPFEILLNAPRVTVPYGKEVFLPLRALVKGVNPKELRVALDDPEGISAEIVTDDFGRVALKLTADSEKVEPGLRGNFLLHAYQETTAAPTETNPNPKPRRTDFGYFPAIPFEISSRTR